MAIFKRIAVAIVMLALVLLLAFGALFWWYGPRAQAALDRERPDALTVRKINTETLLIHGPIVMGDYEDVFKPAFDSSITTVVLDSGGGEVADTLSMAEDMSAQDVDIHVENFCFSSCANYLFTAGNRRTLGEYAVVGFHGNAQALIGDGDRTFGLSAEEIEANASEFAKAQKGLDALLAREKAFFADHGIDQALFERTQRVDKGIEGESYDFLAPTEKTFERYGYFNVQGNQSKSEIERLSGLAIDILLQ